MSKEFLNFLRWITGGEMPDSILKKSTNHRVENNKFKFNCEMNVNTKAWTFRRGSTC